MVACRNNEIPVPSATPEERHGERQHDRVEYQHVIGHGGNSDNHSGHVIRGHDAFLPGGFLAAGPESGQRITGMQDAGGDAVIASFQGQGMGQGFPLWKPYRGRWRDGVPGRRRCRY